MRYGMLVGMIGFGFLGYLLNYIVWKQKQKYGEGSFEDDRLMLWVLLVIGPVWSSAMFLAINWLYELSKG